VDDLHDGRAQSLWALLGAWPLLLEAIRTTASFDGVPAGETTTPLGFHTLISWSGLDIGLDRGSPVGDYTAPFAFTGLLRKVTVTMNDDQALDSDAVGDAEMARQ
jgi:arylsulfatase